MKICNIQCFDGPSIYCAHPAAVMHLDLGEFRNRRLSDFPEIFTRLKKVLPCSAFDPDASFPAIIETIAHALNVAAGISLDNTAEQLDARIQISMLDAHRNFVVLPSISKKASRRVLQSAMELINAIVSDKVYPVDASLRDLNRLIRKTGLSFNTIALIQAAEKRGIPWRRLHRPNLVQLGYGEQRRHLQSSWTDNTSLLASELATHKDLAKKSLSLVGVPVPRGKTVRSLEDAIAAFRMLSKPVVIKPVTGKQGIAVSLGIHQETDVDAAFKLAADHCDQVLIEEQIEGRDYRLLLVNFKFVAAVERVPAHIIGDGEHSIAELIETENKTPARGEGHIFPMCRIRLGAEELLYLKYSKRAPTDIPAKGEQVFLRKAANGSAGGSARDVTDDVHPVIREFCERSARTIGLDICGVDLIAPDIAQPEGWVLEVNPRPGLQPHLRPAQGQSRDVTASIFEMLFPDGTPHEIPVVAIIGDSRLESSATTLARDLARKGIRVGLATRGYAEAAAVLSDSLHELAVIRMSLNEIVERGLPYHQSHVTVVADLPLSGLQRRALQLALKRTAPTGTVIQAPEASYSVRFGSFTSDESTHFAAS